MDDDVSAEFASMESAAEDTKNRIDGLEAELGLLKTSVEDLTATEPAKLADRLTAVENRLDHIEMYLRDMLPAQVMTQSVSFST